MAKAWEQIELVGRRAWFEPRRVLVTGAGPIGLLAALLDVQRGLDVQPRTGAGNDVVLGSVNANLRHYVHAADALVKTDLGWLDRLIARRVPLSGWITAIPSARRVRDDDQQRARYDQCGECVDDVCSGSSHDRCEHDHEYERGQARRTTPGHGVHEA